MSTSGFTLIEMLVALFVFSLISLAGTTVLSSGIQSRDVLTERAGRLEDLQVARAILKADLSQTANRQARDVRQGLRPPFLGGEADTDEPVLAFVRRGWPNPGGLEPRGSLQRVEYLVREDTLVRRAYMRVDAAEQTPVRERTLLKGLRSIEFRFFGGFWADQWPGIGTTGNLPAAVSVEMDVAGLGPVRQVFLTSEVVR